MTGKEFETQFEVGFGEDGVNGRRSQPVGESENGNGGVAVARHHLPAAQPTLRGRQRTRAPRPGAIWSLGLIALHCVPRTFAASARQ
jgi:hypothetical protein